MRVVEDMPAFFADFGDAGTLNGVPVRGIFDRPYEQQFGMASTAPTYTMAAGTAAPQGATLVITEGQGAGTWRVRIAEPEGTGLVILVLEVPA